MVPNLPRWIYFFLSQSLISKCCSLGQPPLVTDLGLSSANWLGKYSGVFQVLCNPIKNTFSDWNIPRIILIEHFHEKLSALKLNTVTSRHVTLSQIWLMMAPSSLGRSPCTSRARPWWPTAPPSTPSPPPASTGTSMGRWPPRSTSLSIPWPLRGFSCTAPHWDWGSSRPPLTSH